MKNYKKRVVSNRNEVVRAANELITDMKKDDINDEYVIVYGKRRDIEVLLESHEGRKHKPRMTKEDVNKGVVNHLRKWIGEKPFK